MRFPQSARVWFLCLLAAACVDGNSTEGVDLPFTAPLPVSSPAAGTPLFAAENRASFKLDRIVVALLHGDVIAHYPHRYWAKWKYGDLCNIGYGDNAKLEWGSGPKEFGDWKTGLGKVFFDTMQSRGANVVGDPTRLFGAKERAQSAEFLVGARITEIKGNICEMHDYWNARPLGRNHGEFYLKIGWEVFSSLQRRVVYKFSTDGSGRTDVGSPNGAMVAFTNAFQAAVARAAGDVGFNRVLERQTDVPRDAGRPDDGITIVGHPLSRRSIRERLGSVIASGVTLQLGKGHGSGFLISRDGYLLTNAHVVGDGERIPVAFSNGVRVEGEVVRVARRRDIALVKIPITVENYLPVARHQRPQVSESVYALGTPLKRALEATLTKGIVSAHRNIDGVPYIQADVPITGGNSGGPLIDERGNAVGVSVAGYDGQNLNLFIPIDEALSALNLSLVVE